MLHESVSMTVDVLIRCGLACHVHGILQVLSDTTETMKAADLCPQAAVIVNMLDEMPDSPE